MFNTVIRNNIINKNKYIYKNTINILFLKLYFYYSWYLKQKCIVLNTYYVNTIQKILI